MLLGLFINLNPLLYINMTLKLLMQLQLFGNHIFFAFSPFSIIPLVLQKIRVEESHVVGCCSKMACTALVAIPNAHGNSAYSDSAQQGEHCVHVQQT
jgi:hypothetical protein